MNRRADNDVDVSNLNRLDFLRISAVFKSDDLNGLGHIEFLINSN